MFGKKIFYIHANKLTIEKEEIWASLEMDKNEIYNKLLPQRKKEWKETIDEFSHVFKKQFRPIPGSIHHINTGQYHKNLCDVDAH